ncbi:BTB/POZ-like protein [Kalmanozyma brasiliensis GHG001]|uniref:BTB/POZ-like protein n=1 Tax=Kalmanozyma brasiliensis (strain GHG001) TaxID=1365824 RepID=UPI001CE71988|nr:BTB/POZ-like protein [Kalmanozyma brasiliensis GHG001]EST08015.2 BTB/POZ-like protein [Kalmanozyma brasiliensis GHG001]
MSQSPARRRSGELSPPADKNNPMETHSITFEWPLHDLKQHFDSSSSDAKSKVIKSVQFGEGRWTVLFYAQSGLQNFCSLYLNAEPTPEEKNQNRSPWDTFRATSSGAARSQSSLSDKPLVASEDGWTRQGLFRFTFKILTLNKGTVLATKEACNHAFSHKTSNWGWAQFASRDTVFYGNSEVQQANAFLVSVTITASAEPPRPLTRGVTVPPALIEAMGSLLDDPDHSDVVFVIRRKHRHPKTGAFVTRERRIYAIKKILASRCEYFRDMFDSGFAEADATTGSDDEADDDLPLASATSRGVGQDQLGLASGAYPSLTDDDDDDLGLEDSDEEMDVDEVYEMGRSNFHDQHRNSEGNLTRSTIAGSATGVLKPAFSGADSSSSRRMRETSSDVPQIRGLSLTQQPVPPAAPANAPGSVSLQQTTPPQSRSRQSNDHDARTDSGEETTRVQGMSAFQTPQHSPRELRQDVSAFASPSMTAQLRSFQPLQAQSSSTGRILPQRRKSEDAVGSSAHSGKKRRKVVVRDAAYATYKALLYYLYTDTIAFAPLHSHFYTPSTAVPDEQAGSLDKERESTGRAPLDSEETNGAPLSRAGSGVEMSSTRDDSMSGTGGSFATDRRRAHTLRQQVVDEFCSANANVPAPCSAKSMYRLADKLQIPDLKKRAQEELANNLTVGNIVWEAFSGFNSQFPAIRKMETDFLLKHWSEVKGTEVMKNIFSRPSAHPGLADIWPHLLSQLEFRGPVEAKPEASASL